MERNSNKKDSKTTVVFDVSPKLAQLIEKFCATNTNEILKELKIIMGKLDGLVQGIADFRADTAAEKEEVRAAFENLNTKIDELQAAVDAGKLDEEQIAQLSADITAARDEVQNIFTPESSGGEDTGGEDNGDGTGEDVP